MNTVKRLHEIHSTKLYRELSEEVGLEFKDVMDQAFCGFLSCNKSQVDKVHVGMVYRILTDRLDIACLETDKLAGRWYTLLELKELRDKGHMESWSELVFDHVIWRGDDE